jgi:hypothetical protein
MPLSISIENCEFRYLCKKKWYELERVRGSDSVRFCDACKNNVYFCGSDAELSAHVEQGHCVAAIRHEQMLLGEIAPPPDIHPRTVALEKVISGGQTGVDRAALDWAMAAGLPVGGWCPHGRLAEDGVIPNRYPLKETDRRSYGQRTDWNVRDSHGTLILGYGTLRRGTLTTSMLAREKYRRPLLCVNLIEPPPVEAVIGWIIDNDIKILNVAGPRESTRPGIYKDALRYLEQVLRKL